MLPVIALAGRPNVGKSTLFNMLTRSRDALVADEPGLTRDRQYGFGKVGPVPYIVVDTGGLSGETEGLAGLMAEQTMRALAEADHILLMVDGREGLTATDQQIAERLRRMRSPVALVVNKAEGADPDMIAADFHSLGLGEPLAISSAHGHNVAALMDVILAGHEADESEPETDPRDGIRVAVIGRPNVGKSTLINRLLGDERQLAFDQPGTTRDSVAIPFESDGQAYTLVDTAGVRRRSKVPEGIEKFSVIKALQAIDQANVIIAVLDAHEAVTDQDATLMGLAVSRGRAMVVAVNKWDGIDEHQRDTIRRQIDVKLPFLEFAETHFISALHGSGVGLLLGSAKKAFAAATRDMPTNRLTEVLEQAIQKHPPPLSRGRRIKLRYAHQGGRNPPLIVIHGNQVERTPKSYRRYLINTFRQAFKLAGTPVRIEFKAGANPFAGRRNKLTPRQQRSRKRLKKHVKKR
ncbi:MAG: ribosome biogenesis GTPase Der [Gammaproteobacteria bacterium]|nr:ribosome biogenesis GTPase Der [Gammaproteobacteria bacterium]